jgi:hypothetical protein
VAFLTRKWLGVLREGPLPYAFHLIPSAFLLILHTGYGFRLSVDLALIINLAVLIGFLGRGPKAPALRAAAALTAAVLLFWLTGGAFYMFAVLLGLDWLIRQKHVVSGLVLMAASGILPAAAAASLFLVPVKQAYLHNLPVENPFKYPIVGYGIPAFYALAWITLVFAGAAGGKKSAPKRSGLVRAWKPVLGLIVLAAATFWISQKSHDTSIASVLRINRSVRKERWGDALEAARRCRNVNPLITFQTNLALFESHVLLDKMFATPQPFGHAGLLMDREWCAAFPEEAGNLYWRLGLVSESQHWTHEAYEQKGATADILERLGSVYMVKGNQEAASRFFRNLENVPFQAKTAARLIQLNNRPDSLARDKAFARVLACMPVRDFVSLGEPSLQQLTLLRGRNPRNRMAFEYAVATHLLDGDLKKIRFTVGYFYGLAYPQIPVHVQEALLLGSALERKLDPNVLKKWLDPVIFKRFLDYQQVMHRSRGNKAAAQRELQASFGDTYWYYLMFVMPASQTPGTHE